ncbi:Aliphatic sulfonates import ATP-binding protein SsuB [bioreactor metagenome]|uniref:Aliphatic sulfonates import ATP-binding protein SsuB n=1 Tax=bioreactor metagenome TaxID=1076179 RepID=A0A645CUE5_9ZZZZ
MYKGGFVLKNISKKYLLDNTYHVIFKDISLNICKDEITVILGESGCGKTTLLKILSNLETIDSGQITYFNENKEVIPKVGVVFQESRLMPWLTVRENITFHSNKKDNINVDKYLNIMKLKKFKNAYPSELSGGMANRVSIARALSYDPDILLMDEPFAALDYFTRRKMQKEVIEIYKSTKKGVIFVTHNIEEALTIANRIMVFNKNKSIKEFFVSYDYNRDLSSDYYVNLKKDILKELGEEEYV